MTTVLYAVYMITNISYIVACITLHVCCVKTKIWLEKHFSCTTFSKYWLFGKVYQHYRWPISSECTDEISKGMKWEVIDYQHLIFNLGDFIPAVFYSAIVYTDPLTKHQILIQHFKHRSYQQINTYLSFIHSPVKPSISYLRTITRVKYWVKGQRSANPEALPGGFAY